MGCTSSAPNTISPNAYTADKSIQSQEETNENPSIKVDVADIENESQASEIKVLPRCDNSEQHGQLVSNIKSSTSLTTENDAPANGHIIENVIDTHINPCEYEELPKIPKLELFMDKIFKTNQYLESDNEADERYNRVIGSGKEVESTTTKNGETNTIPEFSHSSEREVENNTVDEEETKEASPSQSQSSRATRWEALADIAAELPPSLAVDPVTGQIYQMAPGK